MSTGNLLACRILVDEAGRHNAAGRHVTHAASMAIPLRRPSNVALSFYEVDSNKLLLVELAIIQ